VNSHRCDLFFRRSARPTRFNDDFAILLADGLEPNSLTVSEFKDLERAR